MDHDIIIIVQIGNKQTNTRVSTCWLHFAGYMPERAGSNDFLLDNAKGKITGEGQHIKAGSAIRVQPATKEPFDLARIINLIYHMKLTTPYLLLDMQNN